METKNDVNIELKGVINSSAKPLTVNELYKDYLRIIGAPVPVKKLGFRCLHDFIRSQPDVFYLDESGNPNSIVRVVSNEKSQHIANLVHGQKIAKNVSRYQRRPLGRRIQNDFVPLTLSRKIFDYLVNYPDGVHMDDFKIILQEIQSKLYLRCDFHAVMNKISAFTIINGDYISLPRSHFPQPSSSQNTNQPVRRPNEEIIVSSDELTDDGSLADFLSNESDADENDYRPKPLNGLDTHRDQHGGSRTSSGKHSAVESRCSSRNGNVDLVSDALIKNLYALLDENPNGIWLTDLSKKYQHKYGYSLNPQQHGFDCVFDLVNTLKNVFHMMLYEKSGDRHLRDARRVAKETVQMEEGELPKSVVDDIKKMLHKREKPQIFTDELAAEFKKFYKTTLDPTEYGFRDINDLLKSLNENESSIFHFKPVKQRTLMYLSGTNVEERRNNVRTDEPALPDDVEFSIIPKEVCNYDYKLPPNSFLSNLYQGMRIKVKIAEVYGPERFFLHFHDDVRELELMMEDLHQFYECNGDNYELYHDTIRRGMLCACPFYQDSKWHRVQIINFRGTSDVKIRFIDYGTTSEVPISKLRYLHSMFGKYPQMSVRAKLSGIKPKVRESHKVGYSMEVGEEFFALANVFDLEAEILKADLTNPLEVYLYAKMENEERITIHEKLIELGYVDRKEIDNNVEIPYENEQAASQNQENFNKDENLNQNKKKKNRPPPGIPIPANFNPQNTSMSTTTQSSSKFNVQAPPFTVSSTISSSNVSAPSFTAPSSTSFNVKPSPSNAPSSTYKPTNFNVQAPVFSVATSSYNVPPSNYVQGQNVAYSSSRMNPLNPPFYPTTYVQPPMTSQPPTIFTPQPPPYMYPARHTSMPYAANYMPYSAPVPNMFDYYYPARAQTYYTSTPKPPPGFNFIKPATTPSATYFADPPEVPANFLPEMESPQINKKPIVKQEKIEKEDKPAWILKLEKLRDVIEEKNISPDTATQRISQVIDDISEKVIVKKEPEAAPDILEDHVHHSPTNPDLNELSQKLNTLLASRQESLKVSENSSPQSDYAYSTKSDDRVSTRDEIRSQKFEQLRMFVLLQNKNIKKT